jgi:deoxynucleoside triphosphate triphosphohydrolase SAMHD1
MITDALLLADPYLKISDAVDNGDTFVHLSDFTLKEIEKSTCDELAASREIIYDIRRRNLYRFVDEIILPMDLRDQVTKGHVTCASIIQHHEGSTPLSVRRVSVLLSNDPKQCRPHY